MASDGGPEEPVSRLRLLLAFASIYLFWGATFLAIRYAVAEVPPLLTIAVRCLGGALLLFGFLWLRARRGGRPAGPTRPAQWGVAFVAGAFLFVGCHGVLAWAEQRVDSGTAALLLTSIPLSLVGLTALRERRLPAARVLLGLGAGVLGIAVLTVGGGAWSGTLADRAALAACGVSWAAGSLIARHGARPASAIQSTAMQLLCGAVLLVPLSAALGELEGPVLAGLSVRATVSLAFLVVCGTALGFGAYTWLLRVADPAAVGTYAFVNPVVALLLAWIFGDGEITGRTFIAAVLVVGAVVLSYPRQVRPPG